MISASVYTTSNQVGSLSEVAFDIYNSQQVNHIEDSSIIEDEDKIVEDEDRIEVYGQSAYLRRGDNLSLQKKGIYLLSFKIKTINSLQFSIFWQYLARSSEKTLLF